MLCESGEWALSMYGMWIVCMCVSVKWKKEYSIWLRGLHFILCIGTVWCVRVSVRLLVVLYIMHNVQCCVPCSVYLSGRVSVIGGVLLSNRSYSCSCNLPFKIFFLPFTNTSNHTTQTHGINIFLDCSFPLHAFLVMSRMLNHAHSY